MDGKHQTFGILVFILSMALSGCGSGQVFGPTVTTTPTETPVPPTSTYTPIPPTSTNTPVPPTATSTNTPTPTAPALPQAVVGVASLSIYSGPGPAYAILAHAAVGTKLTILGQTNNCAWLEVGTLDGTNGWVNGKSVIKSVACGEITQAQIPTLAVAGNPQSTQAEPSCQASATIDINNGSDAGLYVTLTGPATYSTLLIGGANITLSVCPGSYTWTANGCGGTGTGSGTVQSSGTLTLYCNRK
jgi:uncharacterized protein YraI